MVIFYWLQWRHIRLISYGASTDCADTLCQQDNKSSVAVKNTAGGIKIENEWKNAVCKYLMDSVAVIAEVGSWLSKL